MIHSKKIKTLFISLLTLILLTTIVIYPITATDTHPQPTETRTPGDLGSYDPYYTKNTITITDETQITGFTLNENSITNAIYIPWYSTILYYPNGTVQTISPQDQPSIWWRRWLERFIEALATNEYYTPILGSVTTYIPHTSDNTIFCDGRSNVECPNYALIEHPTPNITTVSYDDKIILTEIDIQENNQSTPQTTYKNKRLLAESNPAVFYGYMLEASQNNVTQINHFTAYLTVPKGPPDCQYKNQYITYWTGIGSPDGNKLIQPVLEWDHQRTGKCWTIAAWEIDGDKDRTGDRIGVNPGDILKLELHYSTTKKLWSIDISDTSTPPKLRKTSYLESKILSNTNLEVFGAVLEGSNLAYICGDGALPDSTTFYDYLYDVPIELSPHVYPNAKQHYKNIGIDIRTDPPQVKLSTGKGPMR